MAPNKHTDKAILAALVQGLRSWHNNLDGDDVASEWTLIQEQAQIGWAYVLGGWLAKCWWQQQEASWVSSQIPQI